MVVVFVVGIAPGFEELGITGYTAEIFGRTGSGTIDAGRIFAGWIGRDASFELDPMPPVVAEVAQIEEPDGLGVRPLEVAQPDQGGFEHLGVVFEILLEELRRAIAEPADDELVKVAIEPTERRLNDVMQLGQVQRRRQEQLAPDRGRDVLEGDLGLNDGRPGSNMPRSWP